MRKLKEKKILVELTESQFRGILSALAIARDVYARFKGGKEGAEMYHWFSKIIEKLDKDKFVEMVERRTAK